MAYESTTVAVSKSQEQIRDILVKHGAERFSFGEQTGSPIPGVAGSVGVEFVFENTMVRMHASLKAPDGEEMADKERRSRTKTLEQVVVEAVQQEAMRVWRVLHWCIKTRMEAIEEGLETFEQSFLPHIVDPSTQQTVWSLLQESVEAGAMRIGGGGMKALGAGRGR